MRNQESAGRPTAGARYEASSGHVVVEGAAQHTTHICSSRWAVHSCNIGAVSSIAASSSADRF